MNFGFSPFRDEKSKGRERKRKQIVTKNQSTHTQKKKSHAQIYLKSMGITFAKLFQRLFSKKEMRILMVRDVLRSRDGFGREERAVYGLVVFFFVFFSFRVKIRDDGTLHFESRCVERERDRVSSSPSEGWMRRVYAGRKCSIICVYISRMYRSIEWVWRRKEDVQKPNRLRGRAAKILVHFYDTSRPFFSQRESCSRLLTKILYTYS